MGIERPRLGGLGEHVVPLTHRHVWAFVPVALATVVALGCSVGAGTATRSREAAEPVAPSTVRPLADPAESPLGDDVAITTCISAYQDQERPWGELTLVAGFDTTAGKIAEWQESRYGRDGPRPVKSQWREHPADEPVAMCYFDGEVVGPPSHPDAPPYDRILVELDSAGRFVFDTAGFQDRTQITRP